MGVLVTGAAVDTVFNVVVLIACPFNVVSAPVATFVALVVAATVVAPTLAGAVVPVVNAPVVTPVDAAFVSAVPTAPMSTPPPPAPLTITGVGAELIDVFTVDCGLTASDGFCHCPVGGAA